MRARLAMTALLASMALASGAILAPAPGRGQPRRTCFCFGWVHGPDFGTSCEPTRAACEREASEITREHTPCRPAERATCDDDATIDGTHFRRP